MPIQATGSGKACRVVLDRLRIWFCFPEANVHLGTRARHLDDEVARLTAPGATFAWEEESPPDRPHRNVVRDPEGNELCTGGPRQPEANE